ncbi:MAG: hypothetical protein ABEJ56_01130 [Candidatus Nanohaloarchaea archaeon]
MRHRIAVLTVLMVFTASGASAAEFSIREDSCGGGEENLFSMHNKSGGNVAEPGYFKWQVCADGIESSSFSKSCSGSLNSILSLHQKNDSHASIYESYRWQVCASIDASLNNSCASQDKIVTLAKKDDSHVAEPGELQYTLCAEAETVDTVTLEMETDADSVYVDGESASETSYYSSELEYPYITSDQPAGIVSYGDVKSINYSTSGSTDIMRVKQSSGSFLVPNTQGGYEELEDEKDLVENRQLVKNIEPSFAFTMPDQATIRVIYGPDTNLIGFDRRLSDDVDLLARNRVDGDSTPDIILEPE